ncbi:hypothetical protein OIU79_001873 [Salix purpurea]|uniref:Uncharacterized protein n=1 Tax=Salix purpurea TaxID=77065 RepID=A0A9Q0URC9_SALPP|nr:hypothetical protein OIU79_001873 [Salix purpurea]
MSALPATSPPVSVQVCTWAICFPLSGLASALPPGFLFASAPSAVAPSAWSRFCTVCGGVSSAATMTTVRYDQLLTHWQARNWLKRVSCICIRYLDLVSPRAGDLLVVSLVGWCFG